MGEGGRGRGVAEPCEDEGEVALEVGLFRPEQQFEFEHRADVAHAVALAEGVQQVLHHPREPVPVGDGAAAVEIQAFVVREGLFEGGR